VIPKNYSSVSERTKLNETFRNQFNSQEKGQIKQRSYDNSSLMICY